MQDRNEDPQQDCELQPLDGDADEDRRQLQATDDDESEPIEFPDAAPVAVKHELEEDARGPVADNAPIAALLDDPKKLLADAYGAIRDDEEPWRERKARAQALHRAAKLAERRWLATLTATERHVMRTGRHCGDTASPEWLDVGAAAVYAWDKDDTGYQPTCAQMRRWTPPVPPAPPADPHCEHDWQWPADGIAVRQPVVRYPDVTCARCKASVRAGSRFCHHCGEPGDYMSSPIYDGAAYQTAGARQCELCGAYGYYDLVRKTVVVSVSQRPRDERQQVGDVKTTKRYKPVDKMNDRDFAVRYDSDGNLTTVCVWDEVIHEDQLDEWSLTKALTIAVQAVGIPRRHQQYRRGVRNGTVIRNGAPTDKELAAMFDKSSQNARKLYAKSGVHKDRLIDLMNQYGFSPDDLYMILNTRFPNIGDILTNTKNTVTQPARTLLVGQRMRKGTQRNTSKKVKP